MIFRMNFIYCLKNDRFPWKEQAVLAVLCLSIPGCDGRQQREKWEILNNEIKSGGGISAIIKKSKQYIRLEGQGNYCGALFLLWMAFVYPDIYNGMTVQSQSHATHDLAHATELWSRTHRHRLSTDTSGAGGAGSAADAITTRTHLMTILDLPTVDTSVIVVQSDSISGNAYYEILSAAGAGSVAFADGPPQDTDPGSGHNPAPEKISNADTNIFIVSEISNSQKFVCKKMAPFIAIGYSITIPTIHAPSNREVHNLIWRYLV